MKDNNCNGGHLANALNELITWGEFKRVFSTAWLTPSYEVEVIAEWRDIYARECVDINEYAFQTVPIFEQVEGRNLCFANSN